ncbi:MULTISPECIES: SGNH/GDSL hydrolase family protein [unclassified Bradyrhizobium]|uniref:SGNH/GDSL hydrolase family protein n=1 Tax=unclassified Bradyrhizobium TaxID=2631580 RepID=UPI0033974649
MADSAISRIEQSFASLNPTAGGFASLGTAAAGVTGVVGGLLAAITQVNSQLADLQKNAEFTGLTAERFQQIQFAAGQGGVSSEDSVNDLRLAIFPRILTNAEVLQAHKYLKAQVLLSGATVPDSRVLIYEGDSITYGSGAANTQGYPYLAASQMNRGERGPNYAVFGSKFADMNTRLPAVLAMCDLAVADGRTPIVHFGIGSNDFALTVSAATLYNQVKAYAATCGAHGAKVIAATVLSRPRRERRPAQRLQSNVGCGGGC